MRDVTGKVAVVTGAASGIGRGMAESFVNAGMKVVLSDVEAVPLSAATEALRAAGGEVDGVLADVSKPAEVEALARRTLERYGQVHVLCNNAGVGLAGAHSWKSTLQDWEWVLGVNLMGVVHGIRTFLPIMLEQGSEAHIVNTASIAGLIPTSGTIYTASKFAVVGLSESLATELARLQARIKISVLCPAYVDTNIMDAERNRPPELAETSERLSGPAIDVYREWFAEQLKEGLSPRAVGDQVLEAIRQETFYILTHPQWHGIIEQRTRDMVQGRNPSPVVGPGAERLFQKLNALAGKRPRD